MKRALILIGTPILLFIGVIIAMSACSTSATLLPAEELKVQGVIEVSGKTTDELYVGSREWMAKTFQSSKAVIEYEDKEAGIVVGKGYAKIFKNIVKIDTWFTFTVEVKDGKVRTTFDNLYNIMHMPQSGGGTKEQLGEITTAEQMALIRPVFESYIESLKQHLTEGEDDW